MLLLGVDAFHWIKGCEKKNKKTKKGEKIKNKKKYKKTIFFFELDGKIKWIEIKLNSFKKYIDIYNDWLYAPIQHRFLVHSNSYL